MSSATKERQLNLKLMGERTSYHIWAACQWLATGLGARTAEGSSFDVLGEIPHGKNPGRAHLDAVIENIVDVSFTTPIVSGMMALQGYGVYAEPHPELRAIAAFPHRDRLVCGIAADVADPLDLHDLADLRERQPALRLIAGAADGMNPAGFATERLLNAYGIEWRDIERWGGQWIRYAGPKRAADLILSREADGIFYEAFMTWYEFADQRPMRCLSLDPGILAELSQEYGFLTTEVEPGAVNGLESPILTLDWSQWLMVVREDLPDWVAGLLVDVIVEDHDAFEIEYRKMPVERSALTYPIEPSEIWKTDPVPLHTGARARYEELGLTNDTNHQGER